MITGQPPITSLEEVAKWVRSGNLAGVGTITTQSMEMAYTAAEAYVGSRVRWALGPALGGEWPPAPGDLVLAVALMTARLIARRNSPDGMTASDELGPVAIAGSDRDVQALMAPYRRVVL